MPHRRTENLRVQDFERLAPPRELVASLPLSDAAAETVLTGREEMRKALSGEDKRVVVIAGPCSIHDEAAALDYAKRLAALRREVSDRILVIMRVYFEKPRTTVGWKGLINDPHLNGTHDVTHGLQLGRRILLAINEMGLPCATEFLDPIVPQYTSDLVSWAAIGARTTESQTHRQMASGLSMPVGFKNATDGGLQVALDAIVSAGSSHTFVGMDDDGRTAIVNTLGNEDGHLVLRGGGGSPNYSPADIAYTKVRLGHPESSRSIMIDCSHGNSNKDYRRQPQVFQEVLDQVLAGENSILGMMLESNLVEGKQKVGDEPLVYGQSITDGCINWEATEALLRSAYDQLTSLKS